VFEADLRRALLVLDPAGLFEQTLVAHYILASKGAGAASSPAAGRL
jgi:hypothetical protein